MQVAAEFIPDALDVILRGGHIDDAVAMQWAPVVDGVRAQIQLQNNTQYHPPLHFSWWRLRFLVPLLLPCVLALWLIVAPLCSRLLATTTTTTATTTTKTTTTTTTTTTTSAPTRPTQVEMTAPPLQMFINGDFNKGIPMIAGSVQDEGATLIWSDTQPKHLPEFLIECVLLRACVRDCVRYSAVFWPV